MSKQEQIEQTIYQLLELLGEDLTVRACWIRQNV